MILIGQYDSPFVRRVAIALRLYDIAFEHRPWSVFSDADAIAAFNPLVRVPTLVLDDGLALIESHVILDHLDALVQEGQRLAPAVEPERHRVLRIAALAMGAAEKAVALFYELRLHREVSELWVERCRRQIAGTLDVLERECAAIPGEWFADRIGHADIALACMLRFVTDAHPGLIAAGNRPSLLRHAMRCEALPVFREIAQPFAPPA